MSAETTPAIQRAAEALEDASWRLIERDMGTIYRNDIARETVSAALNRQEIAQALYEQHRTDVEWQVGATPSVWDDAEQSTRDAFLEQADVVITAILGATS